VFGGSKGKGTALLGPFGPLQLVCPGASPELSDSFSRHIGQTVHARGSAYATCCALHPFAAHRCKGRSFGIEATADVLLTKSPMFWSEAFCFYGFCRKEREPTSGLEPLTCSLRVMHQTLQGFAWGCNAVYLEGFLFPALPCVAPYCVPGGVRVVSILALRIGLANPLYLEC
jgi:hypothetical protein